MPGQGGPAAVALGRAGARGPRHRRAGRGQRLGLRLPGHPRRRLREGRGRGQGGEGRQGRRRRQPAEAAARGQPVLRLRPQAPHGGRGGHRGRHGRGPGGERGLADHVLRESHDGEPRGLRPALRQLPGGQLPRRPRARGLGLRPGQDALERAAAVGPQGSGGLAVCWHGPFEPRVVLPWRCLPVQRGRPSGREAQGLQHPIALLEAAGGPRHLLRLRPVRRALPGPGPGRRDRGGDRERRHLGPPGHRQDPDRGPGAVRLCARVDVDAGAGHHGDRWLGGAPGQGPLAANHAVHRGQVEGPAGRVAARPLQPLRPEGARAARAAALRRLRESALAPRKLLTSPVSAAERKPMWPRWRPANALQGTTTEFLSPRCGLGPGDCAPCEQQAAVRRAPCLLPWRSPHPFPSRRRTSFAPRTARFCCVLRLALRNASVCGCIRCRAV
mmetsp:Transcript_8573/g.26644  ORF Transcript_8573/g.26644 Transcript_8573/m.26644 type:complete len:443 (+) Transcript_8573:2228-3556(+)